jgi:sec-independent protein translocase protein TatC
VSIIGGVILASPVVFGQIWSFIKPALYPREGRIERYVDFLVGFVLPFGFTFELPIVMAILTRSGLVAVGFFSKCRKYFIFLIFILAAILTPPDVISQVLLAIPLIVLFETGILVSRIARKRAEKRRSAGQ